MTSPDGVTWTNRTARVIENLDTWTRRDSGITWGLNEVVWSGDQFLACPVIG